MFERTWGFKSPLRHTCDVSRHRKPLNPRFGGFVAFEAGLVADVGVECEGSEEFSGIGVDDSNIEVVDQENDGDAFVLTADGDVVHPASAAD